MLRELSLKTLRSNIRDAFQMQELHRQYEDYCIELGIESYLLGARYSKFGYYGESFFDVKYSTRRRATINGNTISILTSMTMREIKLQDEELLLNLASSLSAYGGRKDMKKVKEDID